MRVSEVFYSIQGEGKLTGMPSVFIRTSGCNLRCTWCDTPRTSWESAGEARDLDIDEILRRIREHAGRYVVLTGGEPLLAPDVDELTRRITADGYHLTIETAATVRAWIERCSPPLHVLRAELVQNGQLKAAACGKFMDQALAPVQQHALVINKTR